jgi:hypothetical protein
MPAASRLLVEILVSIVNAVVTSSFQAARCMRNAPIGKDLRVVSKPLKSSVSSFYAIFHVQSLRSLSAVVVRHRGNPTVRHMLCREGRTVRVADNDYRGSMRPAAANLSGC